MSSDAPLTGLDSLAVHAGRDDLTSLGVHALPLDLSSTNPLPTVDSGGASYESMATGGHPTDGGNVYARLWNPTVARFETALAALERTDEAVAFSSGMAAMTAAVLAAQTRHREAGGSRGGHVVAVRPLYGGTDHLLASGLLGVEVTFCTPPEVASMLREDTCLVVLETPANPTLELVDIAAVVAAAEGRPVLVDNTFATPVLQNPVDQGATLVLHSATKYLGGHGDAVGGVVAADEDWAAALRRVRAVTGGILHPMGAYLLHRGLPTLPVRVRSQQASAEKMAGWLAEHPAVRRVFYPGTPEGDPGGPRGPPDARARRDARRPAGGRPCAGLPGDGAGTPVHPRRLARRCGLPPAAPGRAHPPAGGAGGAAGGRHPAPVDRSRGRRRPAGRPGAGTRLSRLLARLRR